MNSVDTLVNFLSNNWWLVVIPVGFGIWATVSKDVDKDLSEKTCEFCFAKIDKRASHCRFCGKEQPSQA